MQCSEECVHLFHITYLYYNILSSFIFLILLNAFKSLKYLISLNKKAHTSLLMFSWFHHSTVSIAPKYTEIITNIGAKLYNKTLKHYNIIHCN